MKKPSPVSKKDFEGAFAGLRRILAKQAKHLSVVKDGRADTILRAVRRATKASH
jgi:hypothetical protein